VGVAVAAAALLWLGTARGAEDGAKAAEAYWPAWRGPWATGVSPQADPPISWSETQNVKWKVTIPGHGSATPIVWADRVLVQTAIPRDGGSAAATSAVSSEVTGDPGGLPPRERRPGGGGGMRSQTPTEPHRFVLLCLDRNTGKTLWERCLREEIPHEGHHQADGTFASASPITDGQWVIAFFGSRGLYGLDLEGNVKWSKDLGRLQIKNAFGEGASAALAGNTVVVNWDHEGEDFIAAFDRETGKELWRQPREEDTSWSTPLVVTGAGAPQVVTSAPRRIRSYDLATGKLRWECGGMTQNVVPTPVAGSGLVYLLSGFRGSALLAIRTDASGDVTGTDAVVWRLGKNTPYVPSPLLVDDKLCFFAGNTAVFSCLDAKDGKPLIDAQRLEGLSGVYASPVAAAGRVYLTGRNGVVMVVRLGSPLEILATNRLEERIDASPALAGKELFLRGRSSLYCLARRGSD